MNASLVVICHRCTQVDWTVKTGKPPCKQNGKYFVDNCESGVCPMGYFDHPELVPMTVGGISTEPPKVWGRPLWAEMHAHPHPDAAYIATVTARLSCGTCKTKAITYVAEHPPDGTPEWVNRWHDAVNAELGKPVFVRPASRELQLIRPAASPLEKS